MHDCPNCMSACYCGGDIDDMLIEGSDEEAACAHCDASDTDFEYESDCLDCGTCDGCVERAIAYADEMAVTSPSMKPLSPLRILAWTAAALALCAVIYFAWNAGAATQSTGFRWERETGRQKLTPTTSTALTIPAGTTNAEFYIEGGAVFYRWDGGTVADTAGTGALWNASKWPEGHIRKEENDAAKLSGLRLKCAACTVWVSYSRERRNTDPVP